MRQRFSGRELRAADGGAIYSLGVVTDSGAEESWFDPRRGNSLARLGLCLSARCASRYARKIQWGATRAS